MKDLSLQNVMLVLSSQQKTFFNNSQSRAVLCKRCGMQSCIKVNMPKYDCSCNTLEGNISVISCIFSGSGFMPCYYGLLLVLQPYEFCLTFLALSTSSTTGPGLMSVS